MRRRPATTRKARRGQAPIKTKRAARSKAARKTLLYAQGKEPKLARLARERDEALQRERSTAEVLRVISSSPGNLGPVFETILANAVRICEAKFGNLLLTEGDAFRAVALHGAPKAYAEERRRSPVVCPHPDTTFGRAVSTKRPVQIANVQDEPNYPNAPPGFTGAKLAELADARTVLFVPMVKGAELVGAILIMRRICAMRSLVGCFLLKAINSVALPCVIFRASKLKCYSASPLWILHQIRAPHEPWQPSELFKSRT